MLSQITLNQAALTYINIIVAGLLTGCVYGLMALGLSVIFGVIRIVNFAHGEMMVLAMYAILLLNQKFGSRSVRGDAGGRGGYVCSPAMRCSAASSTVTSRGPSTSSS